MRRIVLYLFLVGILSLSACAKDDPTQLTVISSIKPIQAIVVAIAGDHLSSHQLIPDYASPHHYAFRPSDIGKVKKADVIFYIDEHFEAMLNPVFKNIPDKSKIIALAENPKINFLPALAKHADGGSNEHEEENGYGSDMHIFTSPDNAITMAQQIADTFSAIDSKNNKDYQDNFQEFKKNVRQTSNQIALDLKPFKEEPYVVFHYSWQYFGAHFGLKQPSIIDAQEGVMAGGKTLLKIRKEIAAKNIHCVFSDPSVSSARVNTLIENLAVNTSQIDVLQSGVTIDKYSYIHWLEAMGADIKACLKKL